MGYVCMAYFMQMLALMAWNIKFQYSVEYFACNLPSNDKLPFASQLVLTNRKAMSISLQYHEYLTTLPIETHQAAKEGYKAL